ncbi:MAG: NADP-dependent oxidoreductase [Pseudomonadota bacterium]
MKAAQYSVYGGPDVLALKDVEKPEPRAGECLVSVAGAGLNPVDAKLRSGALDGLFPLSFPVIPGWDVSGIVAAVGPEVDQTWLGKKVFAYTRFDDVAQNGTCAQFCSVPASFLAQTPESLDLSEAASVALVALTAYQSLVEKAQIAAGQSALIIAGGGAVGHYAIQLAKAAGAFVVTTASPGDHEALRAKGADHCVSYRDSDWARQVAAYAPHGFDVILDGVGAETLDQCYALLSSTGTLIGLNDPPLAEKIGPKAAAVRLFSRPEGSQLAQIASLIETGALKLDTMTMLPLSDVAKGHALLDEGHKGKIVLVP